LALHGVYTQFAFSHNGFTIGSLNAIFGGTIQSNGKTTLIDDFKSNGYFTACFSAEDESFGNIAASTGLDRMDFYYDARQDMGRRSFPHTASGSLTVPAEVVVERLKKFLDDRANGNKPLFLYINFQDLHFPYSHYAVNSTFLEKPVPRSQIKQGNHHRIRETYLNTAAYLDENIGKMVSLIEKHFQDNLALVISADHGESLFEDQFLGHGHYLNDFQTRIPIIAYGFPAVMEEPIGQDEIRTLIRNGLTNGENLPMYPIKKTIPYKKIFQYIGNLKRPQQIGWVSMQDRLVLDLRTYRYRRDSNPGRWIPLTDGSPPQDLEALVHYWETIQLQEFYPHIPQS
jgi:phosphoglycerol transferase MdoB-like AlkP superfamily enzyme